MQNVYFAVIYKFQFYCSLQIKLFIIESSKAVYSYEIIVLQIAHITPL